MSDSSLQELLAESKSGNATCQEQLFDRLVRLISVFVRARMGSRLRNCRDSMDVCQSIAVSFFENHRDGKLDFASDAALVAYLKKIVQTKLAVLARRDQAIKRGGPGRSESNDEPGMDAETLLYRSRWREEAFTDIAIDAAPELPLRLQETAAFIESRMTDRDHQIARMRLDGLDWKTIAERLGEDAQSLRKHWSRLASSLEREIFDDCNHPFS